MFKITRDMIKAKGACVSGYKEFCKAFPKEAYPDGVEYQKILDRCAENGRDSYASRLVYTFGKTTDVRKIEGDYISEKSIFVCGRLEVTGKISCIGSIEAGDGIKAGWGIKDGWGLKAGDGFKAGENFEINAGLIVRLDSNDRQVKAKQKPINLICGEFVVDDDKE